MLESDSENAELQLLCQERQRLINEIMYWLLESERMEGDTPFRESVRLHLTHDEVEFRSIARSCGIPADIAARQVRERFLDLLRERGIQIVPKMSIDKLLQQYLRIRAQSGKR